MSGTEALRGETEAWSRAALTALHALAANSVNGTNNIEQLATRFESMVRRRADERAEKEQKERQAIRDAELVEDEANVAKVLAAGTYVSTDACVATFEVVKIFPHSSGRSVAFLQERRRGADGEGLYIDVATLADSMQLQRRWAMCAANQPPSRKLVELRVVRTLGVDQLPASAVSFTWSEAGDTILDIELFGCSPTTDTWVKLAAAGLPVKNS